MRLRFQAAILSRPDVGEKKRYLEFTNNVGFQDGSF